MAGGDRGQHKELFGPWLIRQINNNCFGLSWKNPPEKTIFRIPWKHLSRKDITGQDYDLFKAWAKHGGKYNEQHEDPSTWKTNFRCALNSVCVKDKKTSSEHQCGSPVKDKKMFTEMEDRSGDLRDPHKVYRLIQAPAAADHKPAPPSANHNGLHDSEEDDEDLQLSPDSLQTPEFKRARCQQDESLIEEILQMLSLETHDSENSPLGQSMVRNGHCEQNEYVPEEVQEVYSVTFQQQNGYHQVQQGAFPWCPKDAAPIPNVYHQGWAQQAASPISDSPDSKAAYNNHHVVQNGYAQGVPLNIGVHYATRGCPTENSYHTPGAQWNSPAVPEHSPFQNGYASPTAMFQQDNSPQHQPSPFLITSQYHSAVTEPVYNNHHGTQNGYMQEVPPGNGANYGMTNGPVENSYHPSGSLWEAPAMEEYSPIHIIQQENTQQGPVPPPASEINLPHNSELNTPPVSSLEVTIFYKGKQVQHQQVSTRCLLSFNPADPSLGGLEVVRFPNPDGLPDHKQLEYTKKLLDNVQRGLLLELDPSEKKLIATRLGKCKVFWALSEELENMTEGAGTRILPRETATEIFDFSRFCAELMDFSQHKRASPDYTIYLCFGQCLTEKAKEKKLILVKIVPRFCSFFHEMIQRNGVSSLDSETVSLQISNGSSICLQDLLDLMEWDLPA